MIHRKPSRTPEPTLEPWLYVVDCKARVLTPVNTEAERASARSSARRADRTVVALAVFAVPHGTRPPGFDESGRHPGEFHSWLEIKPAPTPASAWAAF